MLSMEVKGLNVSCEFWEWSGGHLWMGRSPLMSSKWGKGIHVNVNPADAALLRNQVAI